ncbi:hypothetical protein MMC13_004792 [Lambiella insularis]|nr:hypothetical protein [Lambiella insularis]
MTATFTRDELRAWSQRIRDNLIPELNDGPEVALSATTLGTIEDFLEELSAASIEIETLRYSRIHNALKEMCEIADRWTPPIVSAAEMLLLKWEIWFKSLKDVEADLWGPSGRLEGLKRVQGSGMSSYEESMRDTSTLAMTKLVSKDSKSSWIVERSKRPGYALQTGHIGFRVGDWWIKSAAACRDGIIHESAHGITADEYGAYAILMTGDEEVETKEQHVTRYWASTHDTGSTKLMNNVQTRNLVRVLRSWRLSSNLRPKAGLRYDGLYGVSGYGVKLTVGNAGEDQWQYSFTLERHCDQARLERALCHPTADEMDDWNAYKSLEARTIEDTNDVLLPLFNEGDDKVVNWMRRRNAQDSSDNESTHLSPKTRPRLVMRDVSGYFGNQMDTR